MFDLQSRGSNVRTEIIAGASTFMTMSYIIFVQPAVLSICGMDHGAVLVATCIASAVATFCMGILANYPIALAPAMGHNFFFVFTVCQLMGYSWQVALGANFISGALFIFLSLFSFRARLVDAIPQSLKSAIAVGIGLLIALVGMEWAGLVVAHPATLVKLGDLHSAPVLLSLFGVLLISMLFALRIRGAILIGILVTAFGGWVLNLIRYEGIISAPPSIAPTLLKLDIPGVFGSGSIADVLVVIFVFFFLDLFDTIGTLVGISERAGFMVHGKLPRAERALLSDAIGTVTGTILGTSTVTSYIESAAGVSEGGRTGLANMVTSLLFIFALFFYPLARMVGGEVQYGDLHLYPVIAPPLIIVGSMMMTSVKPIQWEDYTESVPAFLTMIMMPLTFSITDGISFGFISYSLIKLLTGRGKEVNPFVYIFAALFIVRYVVAL
ncbi:MAG: NCS2 family permease [Candidatus Abyssobacteria bacterium SURF_17]|uniref:NCS2 family permease n=1 Tax=Candidatus Abyssobacteria bacterium SURF_17 TaxID=2093361 RepID=A0A419F102_9BACT|nr:MAG: NCS2 family permease [Candidatus Abyssubacteria bacterium SURF_17]